MAKEFNNAAIVAKDNDGNKAIVRGGSQEDWEKVGKGLQQIGNLNTAVTELIDRVNGISSAPEVVDANNAQKGITLLTDDPTANKDAATGVTAATPKALQTAVADLKEELAEATVELNDANNTQKGITLLTDDPKANKDAATGVTAATPKAIQAAVAELQEQIADVTVELEDGSDVQKGVVFLTDDPNAEKDAATGVTAATPKAIQDALAAFQEKIESGEISPPLPNDTIDTPTVTVTGAPSSVPASPTITVSAYSGTDTYLCTNWKVVKTGGSEEVVFTTTTATSTLQLTRGLLEESTSYTFMAQYKGVKGTLSEWGSCNATTLAKFTQPAGDIGLPNDPGFGVGVAPEEVYKSLNLKPLPGTEDPESFQYGLYEATAPDDSDDTHIQTYHAYLKYIPKCYHCFLSTDDETLMNEEQLSELVQYTGLTVEQMQLAQERGGSSAIALAPASAFKDEADANAHGFILNRGYYDDGKEKPGFFIANTWASYFESSDAAGNTEIQYYCGFPSFKYAPNYKYDTSQESGIVRTYKKFPTKALGISSEEQASIDLGRKFTGLNCSSIGMWQVIRMICFAAGLYAKDNTECAWYSEGFCAAPAGFTVSGQKDHRFSFVTTSPAHAVSDITTQTPAAQGIVWVDEEQYFPYTTHNGRINGITNLSTGAVMPIVFGATGSWKTAPLSMKLADVTSFSEQGEESDYFPNETGIPTRPEKVVTTDDVKVLCWGRGSVGNYGVSIKQPLPRDKDHTSLWACSFAFPKLSNTNSFDSSYANNLFGNNLAINGFSNHWNLFLISHFYISGNQAVSQNRGASANGLFANGWMPPKATLGGWTLNPFRCFHIGGYPEV